MPSRQAHTSSPVHAPHRSTSRTSRPHQFPILGLATGGGIAALVAVILLLLILYHRLRGRKNGSLYLSSVKLRRIPYRELKAATGSFSDDHKLGQGGFGAVYKGILRNGQEVAVKRLDITSRQGEREFQNEVSIIGQVNSPHIVGLLGFCEDGKRRLLVYEYMHNRSLQDALFGDDYPVNLDWNRRFKIILDTAKALAFLHTNCDPPIIHGDIKPSNVLLDCKFSARIADFGLAKLKTEASGPEVRSEDVESQNEEREKIKQQRRSAQKEKRQRNKESTGMARKQQPACKEAAEECKTHEVITENASCKDSSTNFSTSPNSEGPRSSFSVDQQSSDFHEQDKRTNDAREEAPLPASASAGEGASQPSFLEKENLRPSESAQTDVQGDNASPESPDCLEHESEHATQSASHEQRSTDMSREELDLDDKTSQSEGCFDKLSVESGKELQFVGAMSKEKRRGSFGRDWWWRQESSGEFSAKEYVIEWMGQGSSKEKLRGSWRGDQCGEGAVSQDSQKTAEGWKGRRRDRSRSSEWWGSFFQEEVEPKKEKGKHGREWLKEEQSTELSNKSNNVKKKKSGGDGASERSASLEWWRDEASKEGGGTRSKKGGKDTRQRSKSREWWKDDQLANSKEWKRREKKSLSRDWCSGDLLSRGVSSTPSMRGTICYIAPEYGGGEVLSDKSDVYSFGVLLLVIISGRRPLQVMASPLTEFERANLISWARQLAHSGNVLDLVDAALIGDFSREQATLCITIALLCLQRLPSIRPSMSEVVKILSGEVALPSPPCEFSPSPPSSKGRKHSLSSERAAIDFPLLAREEGKDSCQLVQDGLLHHVA